MHGNMDMRIRSARSSRSSAAWPADVRAYIVLVEGAAVLVPLGRLMSPGSACWGLHPVARVSGVVLLALRGPCFGHALALRSHIGPRPRWLSGALFAGGGSIARLFAQLLV